MDTSGECGYSAANRTLPPRTQFQLRPMPTGKFRWMPSSDLDHAELLTGNKRNGHSGWPVSCGSTDCQSTSVALVVVGMDASGHSAAREMSAPTPAPRYISGAGYLKALRANLRTLPRPWGISNHRRGRAHARRGTGICAAAETIIRPAACLRDSIPLQTSSEPIHHRDAQRNRPRRLGKVRTYRPSFKR